jgi:hypothetical protein
MPRGGIPRTERLLSDSFRQIQIGVTRSECHAQQLRAILTEFDNVMDEIDQAKAEHRSLRRQARKQRRKIRYVKKGWGNEQK